MENLKFISKLLATSFDSSIAAKIFSFEVKVYDKTELIGEFTVIFNLFSGSYVDGILFKEGYDYCKIEDIAFHHVMNIIKCLNIT